MQQMITVNGSTGTHLCQAIKKRIKEIDVPIEKIAELSNRDKSTVLKVLHGISVPRKDIEATTQALGLSSTGRSIKNPRMVRKARARAKAIKIVSMVQSTSALEVQGLERTKINKMIIRTEREYLDGAYQSKLWK